MILMAWTGRIRPVYSDVWTPIIILQGARACSLVADLVAHVVCVGSAWDLGVPFRSWVPRWPMPLQGAAMDLRVSVTASACCRQSLLMDSSGGPDLSTSRCMVCQQGVWGK
jgi:hypothetical protein